MPQETTVRLATADDAETLIGFAREMAMETEGKGLDVSVISAGIKAMLAKPHLGFYLVAESGGQVAGGLMVTTEWSDWRNGLFWWIQSVYVRPENRRQGVYRVLYDAVQTRAAAEPNVCGFRLYVERENVSAQKVYESLGMVETHYTMYEQMCND